jgi:FkbH-like protein
VSAWLHKRNKGNTKPDVFLLEIYNLARTVRMQLSMDYAPKARKELTQIRSRFHTTLDVPTGYSRHEFDRRLFQSFTETGLPFNISLTPEADSSARLVFLSADFVTYRNKKRSGRATPIKCVVWDLDNTIWDGVLVENEDVRLKPNLKTILDALDSRGILLSIASKNNFEPAWRRLEELGIAEYFVVPQISWSPKSESVKTIAKKLNIGIDSLAFIDDNPFELTEVGTAVPAVTCVNVQALDGLPNDPRFQGSVTADAKNRRRYYQEAMVREEKQAEFGADYLRFLKYCDIRMELRPYRNEDFERVAELVQRTNQLNFSGRKYDREHLHDILKRAEIDKYILLCSDRFGSYGLVGFGIARSGQEAIEIVDFMLSCRVQGKCVEQAFFAHLMLHHNQRDARRLDVNFKETNRNEPARQVLEAAEFAKRESNSGYFKTVDGSERWRDQIVHVDCFVTCCESRTAKLLGL